MSALDRRREQERLATEIQRARPLILGFALTGILPGLAVTALAVLCVALALAFSVGCYRRARRMAELAQDRDSSRPDRLA